MRAVILAGGMGTRLRPYTTIIPKPLVPVGDRPILEHIIGRLVHNGVRKVDLCVSHLGELIQLYFTQDGILPEGEGYGHLAMRMFRWSELETLLSRQGTVVAASAAGLFAAEPAEPELRDLLARAELELGAEPGAISCGEHILAVLRKDP